MRQHFAGIPAKAKVSAKTILPSLRSYLRRQAWMDHPPDFQTLGAFRTMYSADFASKFDDSMKGIPQSHQVPFELYRGEPGRFVIKRYNNERIGSIGREYTVDCPVHDGSIPLRVYEPVEATNEVFPVYYHIHGGGFVGGAVGMDAPWIRHLVKALRIVVVEVEYRLAPEYPFPTAREDVYTALKFIISEAKSLKIDPSRLAIGGISAGANLATVAALRAREDKIPIIFQLLVVPVTDAVIFDHSTRKISQQCPHDSWTSMAENPVLSATRMGWFWDMYLGEMGSKERNARELDWTVSPIRAPSLRGLPPTFIASAEIDILRDEGEAYAERLSASGVKTTSSRYLGMPHTFLHYGETLVESLRLQRDIVGAFEEVLRDAGNLSAD